MNYEYYEKIYNDLIKAKKNTTDIDAMQDILESIDIILSAMDCFKVDNKKTNRLRFLQNEYSFVKDSRFIIEDIKDFASNKDNYLYHGNENVNIQFTNKQIIELCKDFFATKTDELTYKLFMRIFEDPNNELNMCNINTQCKNEAIFLVLPYYKKIIISLFRTNTISDVSTLAHEYGHAIQYLYTQKFSSAYIFEEIISVFIEMLCIDYLSNINEYKSKADLIAFTSLDDLLEDSTNYLEEYLMLKEISKGFTNSSFMTYIRSIKYLLKSEYKIIIDTLRYFETSEQLIYIIGRMIGIELLYLYRNDKKRCFKILYKIMDIDTRLNDTDYYQEIKKLGIVPNLHLSEYHNELKRKLSFTTNIIKNT